MMIYAVLAVLVMLLVVTAIRTARFKARIEPRLEWKKLDIDEQRIAAKMSEAVKVPTVSYMDESRTDYDSFLRYHKVLEEQFPLCHKTMERRIINDYSLVYKWSGKASKKAPVLFLSHMDVVPIAEGTADDWKYEPFSGAIEEGFVWGRGTLDTKVTMIGALEAAELLIEKGYVPNRDIYFAFGHDEEIQGHKGAKVIVEQFKAEGLSFEMVLDEGGIVSTDSIGGVQEDVAIVGIGEKGYLDVELSVKGSGGHASMPPKSTALGQLAKAVVNIEKQPMKKKLTKPVRAFLMAVGPSMGLGNRFVLANLWLFKPLFMHVFSKSNTGNALIRTTAAATMSEASNASNVLPQTAKSTVNFRIMTTDSISSVIEHVKSVNSGIDLEVKKLKCNEPSGISSIDSDGFDYIRQVASHVFDGAVVAPYLVMAATDSRYYEAVAKDVYRFAPIKLSKKALAGIHGTNERVSLDNLRRCVSFYMHLMMEL